MLTKRVLVLAGLLALAGCGGGGGGGSSSGASSGSVGTLNPSTTMSGSSFVVQSSCPFSLHVGSARNDGLRINGVQWLQTVEMSADASTTRLAAGKAVTARVDILANPGVAPPTTVSMQVYDAAAKKCTTVNLTRSANGNVPTTRDPSSLANAWVGTISASLVKSGLQVSIYSDDNAGRSQTELSSTYRVYAPALAAAVTETIRIIPITYNGQSGTVASATALANLLVRLHPIASVTTLTDVPLAPNSLCSLLGTGCLLGSLAGSAPTYTLSDMNKMLADVDQRCQILNGVVSSAAAAPKCIGVFPDNLVFKTSSGGIVVGLSYVGGSTMVAQQIGSASDIDNNSVSSPYQTNHWLGYRGVTIAHEMGHLFNLNHADCGGPAGIDSRLYPDGRIGSGAGYDAGRNFYFSNAGLSTPQFADIMSYCAKEFPSDIGYLAEMGYRSPTAARVSAASVSSGSGAGTAPSSQWVRLSQSGNGTWQLTRVHYAPGYLRSTNLDVGVVSDQGAEQLPLFSAVIADAPELVGPYFIDLGARKLQSLSLLKAGALLQQWAAGQIPAAP